MLAQIASFQSKSGCHCKLCYLVARRVVETSQKMKGIVVTVTFVPEQSSPDMEETGPEAKPEVTIPEVKPDVRTPEVKPKEASESRVVVVCESEKAPKTDTDMKAEERRHMNERETAARIPLVKVSTRIFFTEVKI